MNRLTEEAARWFVRMQEAGPDDPERGRFEAWLAADPAHASAYAGLAEIWGKLDSISGLRELTAAMGKQQEAQRRSRRVALKRGLGGVVLLLGAGSAGYGWYQRQPTWRLALASDIGQTLAQTLDDGSNIVLGARTELAIAYSRGQRHVDLLQGEAVFSVASDADRPFVVRAGSARITVLGTRFAVNLLADRVRVSVERGAVKLDTARWWWPTPGIVLTAGQVAEIALQDGSTQAPAQPKRLERPAEDAFAFQNGQAIFRTASLGEIVETLSRYYPTPIWLDPHLAAAPGRINAVVQTARIDAFLETLPYATPVATRRDGQGRWRIERP